MIPPTAVTDGKPRGRATPVAAATSVSSDVAMRVVGDLRSSHQRIREAAMTTVYVVTAGSGDRLPDWVMDPLTTGTVAGPNPLP